ncbi:hypothetical protein L6164_013181 [Bauhinia variegata]|uniref:Uncharacterized protein n=1 Tax=Bauhinia variegata TaxID=167791 RepID=A0ACB9PDS6_BAUVA|nr:hypothetical protein L6164_013181 [Bauhinia variegata]
MKRSELVGNNAIVEAAKAIEGQVRDVQQNDPFKGLVRCCQIMKKERYLEMEDNEGGIEVGLALGRVQMKNFITILKKYISDIANLSH